MKKTNDIQQAPLYLVVSRFKSKLLLSTRIFALKRAKNQDGIWKYPADLGTRKVPNQSLNMVDTSELKSKSILKVYSLKMALESNIHKVENYFSKEVSIPATAKVMVPKVTVVTRALKANKNFVGKDLEDLNAINDILAGKTNAFAILYKRYEPIVTRNYMKKLRFDKDVVDDLVMEFFVKIYEKIAQYKPDYTFNTWLMKSAENHLIDYTRKVKTQPNLISMDRGLTNEEGNPLSNSMGSTYKFTVKDEKSLNGEEIMFGAEKKTALYKAMQNLNAKSQAIVKSYYIDDKSDREIAQEMNIPATTVRALLFRAKKDLRGMFEKDKSLLALVE